MQKYVDECRAQGAKYVVVLSHLGTDDEDSPYTSLDLIANTNGIDAVLDAHSHTEASCWIRQNKDGRDVLLSSTGSKLNKIGQLILGGDGIATVGTVDVYDRKDDGITDKIVSIRSEFESKMETKVGHIDFALPIKDEDGIRMIRTREMPIGDFVADAYRIIGSADIGMCNGGGIAAGLEAGDVTYRDIIAVAPRGNSLCVVKVTGAEIVDMLEYFYRKTQAEYAADGKAVGEEGSFQQVSGLRFTVNTSVATSIQVDDDDAMTGVGDTRRVSDVMVLKDGEYVPIDLSATYTLASHNYMIKNGGSGMLHHLADHELVVDESIADYQVLIDYMNMLGDDIAKYKTVDDRITVK
ncbi:MAG: 5'-nucleotidase C-terminal domain-containing protein [Firmicutes bacterium]|nr:5'-nucleotidase C-terminal domain-containing protein [Candidatus Colimorpha enterica]